VLITFVISLVPHAKCPEHPISGSSSLLIKGFTFFADILSLAAHLLQD